MIRYTNVPALYFGSLLLMKILYMAGCAVHHDLHGPPGACITLLLDTQVIDHSNALFIKYLIYYCAH